MKRNNLWRLAIVLIVVFWSLYEMYPPTGQDLVKVFVNEARVAPNDATFSNIVFQARALQQSDPGRAFANLESAIGTNDVTKFFPHFDASKELYPNRYILNRLQRQAAGKIKLGIDLQGGTSFLLEMDTNALATVTTTTNAEGREISVTNYADADVEGALSHAVEVLRKRVDRFGVAEPVIVPVGDNQIEVQLPGLSEADRESASKQIQRAAFLEFRLVHEENERVLAAIASGAPPPPGYEVLKRKQRSRSGQESLEQVVVKKKAERGLTGAIIKDAMVTRGNLGEPEINFRLNDQGTTLFGDVTRENVGRRLAIVLDGELYSAPTINSPIETGSGQITGSFDVREAFELANVLQNPLKSPLSVLQSTDVDPTLGKDSIRSGMVATLVAVVATFCFMFLFYFFVGFIANFALALNVVILLGLMCSIGTTLTLPGIAGIALAIGMAVDANVLIYERLREEMAAGKSLRGAISAAYSKAFGTIFDSNLTTLISALILIWMGAGPIKGFGVTLAIGLCVHMFTALVVTRLIFDYLLDRNLISTIRILPVIKGTKFDFLAGAKPAFVLSWLLILGGIAFGVYRGRECLGVDFVGGETLRMSFAQKVEVDELRGAIDKLGLGDVTIQYQKDLGSASQTLRVTTRTITEKPLDGAASIAERVEGTLNAQFPSAAFKIIGQETVGASVGKEIQRSALVASAMALFAILVYVAFRYEFSFAVAAVVAGIHDVLLTLGAYLLLGREINGVLMAAVLTIIG